MLDTLASHILVNPVITVKESAVASIMEAVIDHAKTRLPKELP